jgi:hypothetical protein
VKTSDRATRKPGKHECSLIETVNGTRCGVKSQPTCVTWRLASASLHADILHCYPFNKSVRAEEVSGTLLVPEGQQGYCYRFTH